MSQPLLLAVHDDDQVAAGNAEAGWFDVCPVLHPERTGRPDGHGVGHPARCVVDAANHIDDVRAAIHRGELARSYPHRRKAPVPWPRQVFGAPVNFAAHSGELGERSTSSGQTAREMGLFVLASGSVSGPDDDIELPALAGREFHYEGEVAVVIGRPGRHVAPERGLQHVAGITGALDITMRVEPDRKEERSMRKSFRTFTPLGPALLPMSEIPEIRAVQLVLSVNGQTRQRGVLDDLIVDVGELVAMASAVVDLEVGDVILTGTPSGVGPLAAGDTVELAVSGLPTMRLTVREAAGA